MSKPERRRLAIRHVVERRVALGAESVVEWPTIWACHSSWLSELGVPVTHQTNLAFL